MTSTETYLFVCLATMLQYVGMREDGKKDSWGNRVVFAGFMWSLRLTEARSVEDNSQSMPR